jgi:hypothetical protein
MIEIPYNAEPLERLEFRALPEDCKYTEYHRISRRMRIAEEKLRIKKILVSELKIAKKELTAAEEQHRDEIRSKYVKAAQARHAETAGVKLKLWEIYLKLRDAGEIVRAKTLLNAYEDEYESFSYFHTTKANPAGEQRDIALKTLEKWFSEFNKNYDPPAVGQ